MFLQDIYTPCDERLPALRVGWAGFTSTTADLCAAGWQYKCLYNKPTRKYLLRFYHPELFMTFGLRFKNIRDIDESVCYKVKFMSTGGERNRRPLTQRLNTLNVDDVPVLLETIVELQKPIRKKQMKEMALPEADIVDIEEFARTHNVK